MNERLCYAPRSVLLSGIQIAVEQCVPIGTLDSRQRHAGMTEFWVMVLTFLAFPPQARGDDAGALSCPAKRAVVGHPNCG